MQQSPTSQFLLLGSCLACLSLLASCAVLGSSEQDKQLHEHQANAAIYYGGGKYGQALEQVRKGLEIDHSDYKLHTIRAWCLLVQAGDDPGRLREASAEFDELLQLRNMDSHTPQALLGYARCMQKLGDWHLREQEKLLPDGERTEQLGTAEQAVRKARADEHAAQAKSHLDNAERALQRLLDRGDLRLLAHYDMIKVNLRQRAFDACIVHAQAWLELAARAQQTKEDQLRRTPSLDGERELMGELSKLRADEMDVRYTIANLQFQRQQYGLAVEQLDRIVAMDPSKFEVYYNRALALRALGRADDAKRDFQKFLQMSTLPLGHQKMKDAYEAMQQLETHTASVPR